MSRKVPLPEGAFAVNEAGLDILHDVPPEVRPKSGSLSSEEGDNGIPKQGRFFKSLSRSLDPGVAPPKPDFLDAYQQYKAKRAYNLHGIKKQQTIDLGTLGGASTTGSNTVRKFSTGTNVPQSTISDSKSQTLPTSHGSRGPPPPVAPRKKSVNLPPIKEPEKAAHPHDTSSYILSAARKEHHQVDTDFKKFRSLTGPTIFRPKTGPVTAPRKITPTFGLQNGGHKEEGKAPPGSEETASSEVAKGDISSTNPKGVNAAVDNGHENETSSFQAEQVVNTLPDGEGLPVEDHTLMSVAENVEKEDKQEKSVGGETSISEEVPGSNTEVSQNTDALPVAEVEEVVNNTPENPVSEGTVEVDKSKENEGSEQTHNDDVAVTPGLDNQDAVIDDKEIVNNEVPKETGDEVIVAEANKEESTTCPAEREGENSTNHSQTQNIECQITQSVDECVESEAVTIKTKEDMDERKGEICEDNNKDQLSDSAQQCENVEKVDLVASEEGKQSDIANSPTELVDSAGDSTEQQGDSPRDVDLAGSVSTVESSTKDEVAENAQKIEDSTKEEVAENSQKIEDSIKDEVTENSEKVEDSIKDEVAEISQKVEDSTKVEVTENSQKVEESTKDEVAENSQKIEVENEVSNLEVENASKEIKSNENANIENVNEEKVADDSGKVVVENAKPKAENEEPKQPSEKLSKMADMLLSFSGENNEAVAVNDTDLAKVGQDLQNLNSCIDEISEPKKAEVKQDDLDKLENIEAMRKEMEEMVNDFDTYL